MLKNIKHVVGFSGGTASSVAAQMVAQRHPGNTVLLFHNTNTEPPDNDRFRREVAKHIGLPITDNSDGRDIWQLFVDEGLLGNGRNTMCSRVLKRERSKAFMMSHPGSVLYIGYTIEEERRADWTHEAYCGAGIEVRFPLIEGGISKSDCAKIIDCWGIEPPQMYQWADHANCIPCVKGKLAYWGLIYMHERQAWHKASFAEYMFGHTIMSDGPLVDLLPDCLRLAKKYLAKKHFRDSQMKLFESPCECMAA